MDATYAADVVISSVKKSNLNFFIQESPFSLLINIRKTFIKNKSGNVLQPATTSDTKNTTGELKIEIDQDSIEQLQTELNKAKEAVHRLTLDHEKAKTDTLKALSEARELKEMVKKHENENKALKKKNSELQLNIDHLKKDKIESKENMTSKEKEIVKLKIEINNLEENTKCSIEDLKKENLKLKEDVVVKDDELKKTMDEKSSLEEKLKSLLDILYGCHECGLCDCDCHDSVEEESGSSLPPQSSPPDTPYQTSSQHHSPPSSQWTPPPTPPCTSCGGINFGPCPSSVCFDCIPPFKSNIEFNTGSPSRTPPGTPPQLRLEQRAARTRPGQI